MPTALVNGCNVHYKILGAGEPVALTPGGRNGLETLQPLAERLAATGLYRVITYDRRNCGASDVIIAGDKPEHEIWADDLAALLRQLDAIPAWVGGISAGCRVSLRVAIQHPEVAKGLLLWWVTGGAFAAERLGEMYYDQFIRVAEQEGMVGLLQTPFFAERVAQNPSNRERLLAISPQVFIAVMRNWRKAFNDETVVLGASDEQLRAIQVPTVIVPGNDDTHPLRVAEHLHRLWPHATFYPHPWSQEESQALQDRPLEEQWEERAKRLAPLFLDFLGKQAVARAAAEGRM